MSVHRFWRAASAASVAIAVTAGSALAGGVTAAGAAAGHPAAPAARSPVGAAVAPPGGTSPVLLITGDQVAAAADRPGGLRAGSVVSPAGRGLAGSLLTLGLGGQTYDIPAAAVPYLGRGLDLRLFDLDTLRAAEHHGGLAVRISYRGRRPRVPGVRITSARAGIALGYLTAGSARAFGAALDRQHGADRAQGRFGTDGMFAGGVRITLATTPTASASASPARPDFPMSTLTVTGTNLAGKPDTGDLVTVVNADDSSRFSDPIESAALFDQGAAKFSVPTGHYWAVGAYYSGGWRLAVLPQFTVSGNTTVHTAASAATSKVTMVTPRPAGLTESNVDLQRGSRQGPPGSEGFTNPGGPIWVSPVSRKPTVGTLRFYASEELGSPAASGVPYQYVLSYTDPPGLISPQRYLVRPGDLATVSESYFQETKSAGFWSVGNFQPTANFGVGPDNYPIGLPGHDVLYAGGNVPGMDWQSQYWAINSSGDYEGGQFQGYVSLPAGRHLAGEWNRYPLHPDANYMGATPTDLQGAVFASASRSGNTLWLNTTPFTDNQPGNTGSGFTQLPGAKVTGSYEVDQDGRKIAGGNAVSAAGGGAALAVQARPGGGSSVIRFTLSAARTGQDFPLSTTSRTVWTWRSADQTGAALPVGWWCGYNPVTFQTYKNCVVQPMMALGYDVHGLGLDESAPPGPQALDVTAGHLQLAQASAVTGAKVWASFDGGRTWHAARVTATGGKFRAAFTAPPGATVSLRTTATDAAGGSISETISGAYRTGAQAAGPRQASARLAASGASPDGASPGGAAPRAAGQASGTRPASGMRPACGPARSRSLRCFALFAAQVPVNAAIAAGVRGAAAVPSGWGAKDIASAYRLPVSRNPHQTVAVVDAYSTPGLAQNLAAYRKQYGLPACTTSSGCLRIVNQDGKTSPLPASGVPFGWDVETMLDVSMVSAACPHCKILVVQARSDSDANLAAAANTAARLGAQVISNSYGGRESGYTQRYAGAYSHPGHVIVVSSGDTGFTAASFPANLTSVTAAGGTELARASNPRGWAEKVWNSGLSGASGSGCSAYVSKPSWQHDPHCPGRTVADVSALAWNVAIYEASRGGWLTVGGTSAAAPLIAGVYGLAGNAARIKPGDEYLHRGSLFDVTQGNNNYWGPNLCGGDYLCTAKPGYDAPTGLGTPDGTAGF